MTVDKQLRVLVAEDSSTQRRLIASVLRNAPGVVSVLEARDGREAVQMAIDERPDVVVMDVHMPNVDGLAATKQIMIAAPTPIVLMSSLDVAYVRASMKALNVGALSIVAKPPTPSSPSFEREAAQFISTIKALSQVRVVRHWATSSSAAAAAVVSPSASLPASASPSASLPSGTGRSIVAIGASTGGPAALAHLLSHLPDDFAAPMLVVQHIAPGFSLGLADWLNSVAPMPVTLARHGQPLLGNRVYIAPDGQHLGVADKRTLVLDAAPPVSTFRPAATYLFQSVARVFGRDVVAVILSGMGSDGAAGLAEVYRRDGYVIAQDKRTCAVFGMPQAAIAAGVTHCVLPLERIAPELLRVTGMPGGT